MISIIQTLLGHMKFVTLSYCSLKFTLVFVLVEVILPVVLVFIKCRDVWRFRAYKLSMLFFWKVSRWYVCFSFVTGSLQQAD